MTNFIINHLHLRENAALIGVIILSVSVLILLALYRQSQLNRYRRDYEERHERTRTD